MTINVQLVYGAGNDALWGKGLDALKVKIEAEFGSDVNVPDIVDYLEYDELSARIGEWKNPIVLIGHSCGVSAITKASVEHLSRPIPYMMGIATSMFCRPKKLDLNVVKATEIVANSNLYNLFKRQLMDISASNDVTKIETAKSGRGHVESAEVDSTHNIALREIRTVIDNNPPPFVGV